jgi:multidrug efflux pump subunit AcrB
LLVNIQYSDGTTITQAEEIAFATNEVISDSIGAEMVELDYGGEGLANTSSADIRIQLTNFRERDVTSPQLVERLENDLTNSGNSGVIYNVSQQDPGGPQSPLPFSMQIYSEDASVAMNAADDIEQFVSGLTLTLNNGDEVRVVVTDQSSSENIYRTDGRQYVAIYAGYDSDQVSELLQLTREEVKEYYTTEKLIELGLTGNQETDLGFDFGFESENEESFQSLGQIGIFSLIAMFVLLTIQFRSLLKPILIFLAIPFSLFGVTFGLSITGNSLSFFAMIGFIGLIGIAVNNTILLVDAASRYKREGNGHVESIALGLEERFRPLLTTTTTTVVALLPLAIFDPFWEPLAVTIIFGLISSTILVVLSFPAYYIAFDVVSDWFGRVFKKGYKK